MVPHLQTGCFRNSQNMGTIPFCTMAVRWSLSKLRLYNSRRQASSRSSLSVDMKGSSFFTISISNCRVDMHMHVWFKSNQTTS